MITLQKRDLVAGAIMRGFLAAADEGRAITDQPPDPKTLIQVMLMRFGAPLVGDRLGLAYPRYTFLTIKALDE